MAKEACPFGSWSPVNDDAILTEKERKRMAMPWRIWELAVARANNWGHAGFRKGELVKLCCGENNANNRLAVTRGMKTLRQMGRIAPDSTAFCIVVNRDYVWRGAGKGSRMDICMEPTHMDTRVVPWNPEAEPDDSGDPWAPEDVPAVTNDAVSDDEPKRSANRIRFDLFDNR